MESKYQINFIKPEYDPSDEFWGISEIQIAHAAEKQAYAIDSYMQAHIQPKPRWIPKYVWYFLLKKLLVLKHFKNGR